MATFKRAEVHAVGDIVLTEVEKRAPAGGEVLIRVKAAAVCGSDLHIYHGKHPYWKTLPTSIGHELAGQVEAVGPGVERVKPGDRVTVEPLITCGTCHYCLRGRYDYCQNLRLKYRSDNSAFGEYYYADERWVHLLPDSVSYEEGSLMEPFACSVHAVLKGQVKLCDSVCVLGEGSIAFMLLQLAIAAGATTVYFLGRKESRLKLAEQFGAIPMRIGDESVEEIKRQTGNRGVDVSFEAVGVEDTFKKSLAVVRRGGRAVIFGIFGDDFSAKPLIDAMVREVEVVGTSSYCWDFQRGLDLLEKKRVDLNPIITHRFSLDRVKEAMDLKQKGEQPIKVLLLP